MAQDVVVKSEGEVQARCKLAVVSVRMCSWDLNVYCGKQRVVRYALAR